MDDILIIGSDPSTLKACIHDLDTSLALKTLGSVNYFLRFEAFKDKTRLYLTQSKYTMDLLHKVGMRDCKACDMPVNVGLSFTDEGDNFSDSSLYRTIIGSLQYLTYTRPNISFVVNKLSEFLSTPKIQHWTAYKRLLRYLKGTIGLGLLFTSNVSDLALIVYTDADHVGCKVTRKSTSGICVFLGLDLLVWNSRNSLLLFT